MKITILSTAYPLRGGIAHFNGLLYKELSKNHNTNVVTFKRQYPDFLFPGKSQTEDKEELEKIPSEVLVDSVNPLNWIKVGQKIKKEKPDLLIFKFWMPFFAPCFGTISRIVKRNRHTKILVINDNVIPHEKRPGDITFTRYFFRYVHYFISMSKKVDDDLALLKPSAKKLLLFHPVYSNFGELIPKSEARQKLNLGNEKVILFFGFIRNYKGLDILLKAAAFLKNKIEIKVMVAGEFYEDEQKYYNIIENLKIKDIVRIDKDFIPTSEVKYYFSASDVVVLPYKDATQSGIVQIANNFLKPVIATKVGGLPEVIEDNITGNLVESNNPEKLAECILDYFDRSKESLYTENIKKNLDNISWSAFTEKMLNFIING